MREKSLIIGALAATALACAWGVYKMQPHADAAPAPRPSVKVFVAVVPANAYVVVNGEVREHPSGAVELNGPLGAVFTVEVKANGAKVIERVAITDDGALPAVVKVPEPLPQPPVVLPVSVPVEVPQPTTVELADCTTPYWFDGRGVKHYKPKCLGDDSVNGGGGGMGALTVVCLPRCDEVIDNGTTRLGPGHIFNRPVPAGRHTLTLSAPNGTRKIISVQVVAGQTKEVRMSMDDGLPAPRPLSNLSDRF